MSFEEKGAWIYLALAVIIPALYFTGILSQVGDTPASEISYIGPMIGAIAASIVAFIVLTIIIAIANPREADKADERDKNINRLGEYIGGYVLAVAIVGVLIMTMIEVEYFWIANAIYAAFILQAITSSTVKIVAYRRGM